MSPHEPEDSDGDWVKRYRQASDADAAMPSAATREAILAEGRRVAAARAADATKHQFDTKQPAANQPRWKLAAFGTVGAALFAAVLMYPHIGAPPSSTVAEMASTTVSAVAPVPELKKQTETQESDSARMEEVVVTGARKMRAPDRTAAQKSRPVSSSNGAPIGADAGATPRESQDTTSQLQAGAQPRRMAPQLAAPPPTLSSAPAAQAVRSNLTSESLLSSVASGDLALVGNLLNAGVSPEQSDSLGRTPLLLAVISHREDMVGLLLAHHADPNVPDHSGQTPLQRARLDAQLNLVQLLERAGAH